MKIDFQLWGTSLIGLTIISGIGYYVQSVQINTPSKPTVHQLLDKCVVFNSSPGMIPFKFDEIQSFMKLVDQENTDDIPHELRMPYDVCMQDLRVNIKKYASLDRK